MTPPNHGTGPAKELPPHLWPGHLGSRISSLLSESVSCHRNCHTQEIITTRKLLLLLLDPDQCRVCCDPSNRADTLPWLSTPAKLMTGPWDAASTQGMVMLARREYRAQRGRVCSPLVSQSWVHLIGRTWINLTWALISVVLLRDLYYLCFAIVERTDSSGSFHLAFLPHIMGFPGGSDG